MGRISQRGKSARPGSPLAQHIGLKLLALRERDSVTMRTVGEGTGLSNAFICQLENGQSSPSADTLWVIARYFKVPVQHFFKGFTDG